MWEEKPDQAQYKPTHIKIHIKLTYDRSRKAGKRDEVHQIQWTLCWNTHISFPWIGEANRTFLHPCPLLQKEQLRQTPNPHNKHILSSHTTQGQAPFPSQV